MLSPEDVKMYEDRVTGPGKFKGEPAYVPYFYDLTMDSSQDDTIYDGDTPVFCFDVTDTDRKAFPDLADVHRVYLWESEQGFVYHRTVESAKEANELESSLSNDEEE